MFHLLLSIEKNKKIKFLVIAFVLIFVFTIIYWLLGSSENFTFNPYNSANQNNLSFLDALYFSLGTQTTIGYGDITAKSQLLRGITIIQMSLLVVYVAFANL